MITHLRSFRPPHPWRRLLLTALLSSLVAAASPAADNGDALVLVAHPGVASIDLSTAQRLWTGRAVRVGEVPVTVVNLSSPQSLRDRFLRRVVGQDNDNYLAYWTVRRHVGKGTPPRELANEADVLRHVAATPGAIGYVSAAALPPGANVVLRP